MGIPTGHDERGVAENIRHHVKPGASSAKARGRRVPQIVKAEVIKTSILDGPAEQDPHAVAGVALPLPIREHKRPGRARHRFPQDRCQGRVDVDPAHLVRLG